MIDAKHPRILVVDDEEPIRTLISRLLDRRGYTVSGASRYDEAMDMLATERFDILLTDHMMPGKKGLDLIVESNKKYPDIIKILFTGMGGRDLYREIINKGAVFSLIEKPFTNDQLVDTVDRALEFRSKRLKELKQIERLQEQFHTIFDHTTDLIQSTDLWGSYIYVNPAWHKALGYTDDDLEDLTVFDIIHEDCRTALRDIIDRLNSGEMVTAFDTVMIARDGSRVYLEGNATAQMQQDDMVAVSYIFRDVTERKRAADAMRHRLKQETMVARIAHLLATAEEPKTVYGAILEIVGETADVSRTTMYRVDRDMQAFVRVGGWSAASSDDSERNDSIPYSDLTDLRRAIQKGEVVQVHAHDQLPKSVGAYFERNSITSCLVLPVYTGSNVVGVIEVDSSEHHVWDDKDKSMLKAAVDIIANAWTRQLAIDVRKTKEKEAEESRLLVIRADRLAALGTMAAGIIHEITQPLNAINVSTQTILYGISRGWQVDSEQVTDSLNLIVDQIKRMNDIITNMRAFARDGMKTARETTSLNMQVNRVIIMMQEQMRAHNIDLEINYGDLPDIEMNSQQILQVILNLITNSRQALDEHDISEKKIRVNTYVEDSMAVLEVTDNGPGIPDDLLDKIFDPFFTTKEVGKGTGLGLSISGGIVVDHNGVLDAWTNDEGGATFIMKLPMNQG